MKITNQPEYSVWTDMKQRCFNQNHMNYKNYGAKGITVCESWKNSYTKFIEDMGPRPSNKHSIDRIDNNGNYEPANCRWATREVQNYNKSTTFKINIGHRLGKLKFTGNKKFNFRNDKPTVKRWYLEFICDCGQIKWIRLDDFNFKKGAQCGNKNCKIKAKKILAD